MSKYLFWILALFAVYSRGFARFGNSSMGDFSRRFHREAQRGVGELLHFGEITSLDRFDFWLQVRSLVLSNELTITQRHSDIMLSSCNRLSGSAAVKSKNVCLQLVDNHTDLTNSGVVQLFTQPHPQKIIPSPYWGKVPPRLRSTSLINKSSKFFFSFII